MGMSWLGRSQRRVMVLGGEWGMENLTPEGSVWAAETGCMGSLVSGFPSPHGIFTHPVKAVFLGAATMGPLGHAWMTACPLGPQP